MSRSSISGERERNVSERDTEVVLADGDYDVVIVDARELEDGRVAIDCAIASGAHRGAIASVVARSIDDIPLEMHESATLLGLSCTLVVEHEVPRLAP